MVRSHYLAPMVIPQKKKLSNDFFFNFRSVSVSKTTIEKIGHRVCLRGVIGWSYPIFACAVMASFSLH